MAVYQILIRFTSFNRIPKEVIEARIQAAVMSEPGMHPPDDPIQEMQRETVEVLKIEELQDG